MSMGLSLGSQIEPVGCPGPHKAAKSTQQGCQEQADQAIRGQMDPARAPEAARSSQLRPDRASQGGPGRLAGRPADCATPSWAARQASSRIFDMDKLCRNRYRRIGRWEGVGYLPQPPPGLRFFFGCSGSPTKHFRTPIGNGPRTDSERNYTKQIPNRSRTESELTPNGP